MQLASFSIINMLCFSSKLKTEPVYRKDAENLFSALCNCGEQFTLIQNTKGIWARDYMPIATRSGRYISFRYEPSYLKGFEHLQTNYRRDVAPQFNFPITYSDINLDGGNIVFSPKKSRAIISERVFFENPGRNASDIIAELSALLEAEILIMPCLKPRSDMTGHADGMVRFLDECTVLCNRPASPHGFETRVKRWLKKNRLGPVDFPFFPPDSKSSLKNDDAQSAEGCYINFLQTQKAVFLPTFGIPQDADALFAAREIFKTPVIPVSIPRIAAEGGCLNCISWN